MADDGSVVGESAKFVRLDTVFLDALVGVGRVIQMYRTGRAFHPMLAERVRTAERVGFRSCPIHDEILQIEREDFSLFPCLRRDERLECLRGYYQHEHAITQSVDNVEVARAIVTRRD